jgi:hypothetical protein
MKITEIKEDMYQYISLRDSIESSKESNKVIDEEKRTLINSIELKYKNFFKTHLNVEIIYNGITSKNYGHVNFEDLMNILIKFKGSEFKVTSKNKKSKKNIQRVNKND